MNDPSGRISLFITLGIAAIDMLTCAFVSAVVLFFLFLVPKQSAGASSSEDLLLLHWSAVGAKRAIVGIRVERNGQPSTIWSDDVQTVDEVCSNLSRTPNIPDACYLLNSVTGSLDQDGILVITRPLAGQWSIAMAYGDTSDNGNSGNYPPVNLRVTLVRANAIELTTEVAPGGQIDLATVDTTQTSAIRQLLLISPQN